MREIKFRFWDANTKVMDYDRRYIPWADEEISVGAFFDTSEEHPKSTWLQYTGLKDENGVEIYEGDLLEGYDPESNEIIRPIMGVYWSSRGMWDCESFILGGMNERCKVVGNIYENPKLID